MIDYAQVRAIEEEQAKVKSAVRVISVKPLYLSLAIVVCVFLYFLAYQNMSIAETKHKINQKNAILHRLIIERQNLLKKEYQCIDTNRLLQFSNDNTYGNIQIEH